MQRSPWPDFYVVGAGKSGTTTLYDVLQHHRHIYVPPVKEPKYFGDPKRPGGGAGTSTGEYLALYREAGRHQLRGDFSTSYFVCPEAPARIRACNEDARFIVILRDPVSRAYSDYLMLSRRDGLLRRDFVSEVRCELERLAQGKLEWPFLVRTGLYYRNIRNFIRHFPSDRFLFLCMSDLIESPEKVYARICEFLEIDVLPVDDRCLRRKRNSFAEARSPVLQRLLSGNRTSRIFGRVTPTGLKRVLMQLRTRMIFREAEKPTMPEEAWRLLQPVFAEDLRKLQELTGFDVARLQADWPRARGSTGIAGFAANAGHSC